MKKSKVIRIFVGIGFIMAFIAWTLLVCLVDVKAIGPQGSSVGLATLNGAFHELTEDNITLYIITDWLGLVPIATALGFAILGLIQLIKSQSIAKVDVSILALGVFYITVIAVYLIFEEVVINYRPILIGGNLEASYPSSTTMLVTCVMPTALMQFNVRIKQKPLKYAISAIIMAFIAFMVIGRLISGVHWLSDIIGGALISIGLVTAYSAFLGTPSKSK